MLSKTRTDKILYNNFRSEEISNFVPKKHALIAQLSIFYNVEIRFSDFVQ